MPDQLQQQYLASLEKRAGLIKALWQRFLQGEKDVLEEIRLQAHSLKGSGGTFGLPEVSAAGQALESAHDAELRDRINALLNIIGRVTANKPRGSNNNSGQPTAATSNTREALIVARNTTKAAVISTCISALDDVDHCVVVGTGSEARENFQSRAFALIVLDLVLPDVDGREILREIKQQQSTNSPVLVISGVPSDQIYMECMSVGADQYLTKPFDTDKLRFEAQQILQRNRLTLVDSSPGHQPHQAALAKGQLQGEYILVAEDDDMQALFMSQKLTEQGARVSLVENGKMALEALENSRFNAIVLDGLMPEMGGFETLKEIRSNTALRGVPVIMVTATGSEQDIIKAHALGANDYILKPFTAEQLVGRIRDLLQPNLFTASSS